MKKPMTLGLTRTDGDRDNDLAVMMNVMLYMLDAQCMRPMHPGADENERQALRAALKRCLERHTYDV